MHSRNLCRHDGNVNRISRCNQSGRQCCDTPTDYRHLASARIKVGKQRNNSLTKFLERAESRQAVCKDLEGYIVLMTLVFIRMLPCKEAVN